MESIKYNWELIVPDKAPDYVMVIDRANKNVIFVTDKEEIKQAKIIASAPELLEALKLMVQDYWADYPEKDREAFRKSNPNSNIVKAEQVINKATL